jgi:hypothetical protein
MVPQGTISFPKLTIKALLPLQIIANTLAILGQSKDQLPTNNQQSPDSTPESPPMSSLAAENAALKTRQHSFLLIPLTS